MNKLEIKKWALTTLSFFVLLAPAPVLADQEIFEISIKDHQFYPAELSIPSGKRVKIVVINEDPSAEEFESYDLNREKVVAGNSRITLFLGPLKPGVYHYFGEFHKDTAKGTIKAAG